MIRVRSVSALDAREGKQCQRTQSRKGETPKTRDIGMIIGRQLEKKKDECENFTSNASGGFS